jgi:hypothetical protein
VTGVIEELPSCAELIARIVSRADEVLERFEAAAPGRHALEGERAGSG